MALTVTTGHASLTGLRASNEDYVGLITATGSELVTKGLPPD